MFRYVELSSHTAGSECLFYRKIYEARPPPLPDLQLLFFNTFQKVINGIGWLYDRHGPSPILYDTVPLFVYIDQLL